jgi:5-methyltetrahydrofolate--homocysteine methyltransferase
MLIIGERINATRKSVGRALAERSAPLIQDEARRQAEAGADVIDVNAALSPETEKDLMVWAVETVREVTDKPIAVDTASPEVARAGLERLPKGTAFLNSATGETGRLGPMAALAAKFEARLVALAMDDRGMPESVEDRWRALDAIFAATDSLGIGRERILVDPLLRPVSTNPEQVGQCLEAIRQIRCRAGGAGTVVGLSNISFGLPSRRHLNRTFLAMAIGAGLTAAILDPLEEGLVATALAGACLAREDEFCMNYIAAQRRGRL